MWHRSLYDTVKQAKERGLCLYGTGVIGNAAYRIFAKMGVIPECYCDDAAEKYESDKLYNDIPVYSLEYAKHKYPNAVYIVCADHTRVVGKNNKDNLEKMLGKLKKYGLYDANSEMRIAMYLFVLDIGKLGESLTFDETTEGGLIRQRDLKQILVLNHMGNSGSYYFEQLLDSHYGDIIYGEEVLKKVLASKEDMSVIVDDGWYEYWSERCENPLDDAESLMFDDNDYLTEIGQKTDLLNNVQSQYIGLMRFKGDGLKAILNISTEAERRTAAGKKLWRTERNYAKMYMTDLLQGLIDENYKLKAVHIKRGWFEIDDQKDLKLVEKNVS